MGGTQFVGKYIVDAFLQTNHNITLFNRGNNNPESGVKCLYGDRLSRDFSSLENTKWDVVIDVPYFETDVVSDTLEFLYDKTDIYTFISSVSVYDVDLYPDSLYDSYCKNKLSSERLFHFKDLKSLILRPGMLCGVGDNTNRFIYHDDGEITWEHTNQIVGDYIPVGDFANFVVKMIEEHKRGVYEYVVS